MAEGSFGCPEAPSGPTRQVLRLGSVVGRRFGPAERDPKEPEAARSRVDKSHVFPPLAIAVAIAKLQYRDSGVRQRMWGGGGTNLTVPRACRSVYELLIDLSQRWIVSGVR